MFLRPSVEMHGHSIGPLKNLLDSEVLAASRPYWIRVVGEHGYALAAAPRALRGDRDVVLAAVRRHGLALKSVDTKLRADRG